MSTNRMKNHCKLSASMISLLLYFIIYLFFAFYDGVFLSADSETYINMSFAREPIYPLILAVFRLLDANNYLLHTVIFQSVLAAFCGWILSDYLGKRFDVSFFYRIIIYTIPLGTSLLCRFAAKRATMYSNSILTEGITISLYLLFVYCLLKYLLDNKTFHLYGSVLLSILMISTRKQMLITIPLIVSALVIKSFREKQYKKYVFLTIFLAFIILLSNTLLECSYNYALRGQFEKHSSGNRFFTTMIFYNAQLEDVKYIENPEIQDLFLDIYYACDEKQYLGLHAPKGWLSEVSHFGDHYDHIQIDTMWPMILEHARTSLQTTDTTLVDMEADRVNNIIITSILPHQIPDLLHSLYNNFLSGLMTTIAQRRAILIPFCIILYLLYVALTLRLIIHKSKDSTFTDTLIISAITLAGIIFNVGLVSAVIFCQARYTIYNMPLFYISGVILFYQNLQLYRIRKKEEI